MNHARCRRLSAIALLLSLCSRLPAETPPATGKLITSADLPVLLNGNSARGGATILSPSVLETPGNAAALVQLSGGEVELPPDSVGELAFDAKSIKVTLTRGCVVLQVNKGVQGVVVNEKGAVLHANDRAVEGVEGQPDFRRIPGAPAQSDGGKFRRFPVCDLRGAPSPPPPAGFSGVFIGALVVIVGGSVVLGGIITGGGNPSP
jgi:hypothetical protein